MKKLNSKTVAIGTAIIALVALGSLYGPKAVKAVVAWSKAEAAEQAAISAEHTARHDDTYVIADKVLIVESGSYILYYQTAPGTFNEMTVHCSNTIVRTDTPKGEPCWTKISYTGRWEGVADAFELHLHSISRETEGAEWEHHYNGGTIKNPQYYTEKGVTQTLGN